MLLLVGSSCLCANEDKEKVTKNNDFVQRFVDDFKDSPVIKFDNGQLKLWARMSDEERKHWLIGTLGTLLPGIACLGGSFFTRELYLQLFLIIGGASFLLCSGIIAFQWEKRAEKERVRRPYLVLNEDGVSSLKGKQILWQDINNISLQALDFFNPWGTKVSEVRVLSFLDKYNNVVLQFDKSDMLPISVDNLKALADYFFNKFKENQKQQLEHSTAAPAIA
jgi:hypothetical protein